MSGPVAYVDRFTVAEGKLEDLRRYCKEMTELVEKKEPETISFSYFVDEDGKTGSAVFIFADGEALDLHLDVASHKFQEAIELISSSDIELLGPASEQAQQISKQYGATIKTDLLAGFARSTL